LLTKVVICSRQLFHRHNPKISTTILHPRSINFNTPHNSCNFCVINIGLLSLPTQSSAYAVILDLSQVSDYSYTILSTDLALRLVDQGATKTMAQVYKDRYAETHREHRRIIDQVSPDLLLIPWNSLCRIGAVLHPLQCQLQYLLQCTLPITSVTKLTRLSGLPDHSVTSLEDEE
jgi:hypothetical protein